ncbi:MAG TPA: Xaa-Pro peptidase family protein [Solirubrobacterales bacterium]|jgi:Xaa-Pro aminopeptidase|nr:Xaa-Pro peptidase family protein [Solirubrobacterales bacterium]
MAEPTAADGRAARLAELVSARELDLLFVSDLVNIRYLAGFTGTSAACLVGPSTRTFLTDFRYTERAEQEVGEGWDRPPGERDLLPQIAKAMSGRVGFEDAKLSVRQRAKLGEAVGEGVELVEAGDLVEELRAVKDPGELDRIAAAAALADDVYGWTLGRGLAGSSERTVAGAAEARIRELGAEPSFPPIVAAGPNGALPHAEPGERVIGAGELVVFDMGAQLDGYCSDCTRTFATGEPGDEARAVYELVRATQATALEATRPGIAGRAADQVSRDPIAAAGHGEHYGHGLGHGVGLEVHEGPRLSQTSDDELREGNVVTVEPGVYLPGRFGVRIEDLVVVEAGGIRNLSGLPKELTIVE